MIQANVSAKRNYRYNCIFLLQDDGDRLKRINGLLQSELRATFLFARAHKDGLCRFNSRRNATKTHIHA